MKIRDIIFCDDIRSELNNKYSLIGIYGDRIVFTFHNHAKEIWPLPARLCLMLRFQSDKTDPNVDSFDFYYMFNGRSEGPVKGTIGSDIDPSVITVNIMADAIPLEKGVLGFQIKLFSSGNEVFSLTQADALKVMSTSLPN